MKMFAYILKMLDIFFFPRQSLRHLGLGAKKGEMGCLSILGKLLVAKTVYLVFFGGAVGFFLIFVLQIYEDPLRDT